MDRLWKTAIGTCGIGALGALVLWSLYKEWLHLPVFSCLSPRQTLIASVVLLVAILLFGLATVWAYVRVHAKQPIPPSHGSLKPFPETEWKTGSAVMRDFTLSSHELLQHIESGLPVYPANTDIYFKDAKAMEKEDVWFESEATDPTFMTEELPRWLFKTTDIMKYTKESTQPVNRQVF